MKKLPYGIIMGQGAQGLGGGGNNTIGGGTGIAIEPK
tara:strand:+ start:430 stop:540 length:111 start_codon:yes stop_codon:yes gene_type:complete